MNLLKICFLDSRPYISRNGKKLEGSYEDARRQSQVSLWSRSDLIKHVQPVMKLVALVFLLLKTPLGFRMSRLASADLKDGICLG